MLVSISLRLGFPILKKLTKHMDADAGDFLDWEVLTDPEDSGNINSSDTSENMPGLDGFERDIIGFDNFSLEQNDNYGRPIASDDGSSSAESNNPSWIDPGTGTETDIHYARKDCWTDSSSERSDDRKVGDFEGISELGIAENAKLDVGVEIGAESEESLVNLAIDDKGNDEKGEMVFSSEEKVVDELNGENEDVAVGAVKSCGEEGKSGGNGMVWWKLPLDILKYSLLRASPVWTVSVAAAMMGFVILGRRLYKMKRKSRSLQLNVTVDDKKVSQFMSRAARLNEAFSVVKRVPIVRPSLPAIGVTPWPMMSLR